MYAFSWAEKSPVGPSCISWANGHSFRHILLGRNRLAGSSDIICWVNTKPTGQRLGPKSLAEPFRDDMDIEYPAGPIRSSFRDIYTGPIRHSQYLYPNTIGPLILLISHLADPPAWVLFQAVGPSVISYAWAHIGWPASLGRFSTFGCPTKSGNVTEGARTLYQPLTWNFGLRSLCAHRWLKQIVANGSSANFRIYWSGLMKEKQLAYDPADTLKLVKDNIWNGNTVDIINKISSGSLY
ncbi:uncharacterized protein F5891DRAFT_1246729 [Suillus fuscotomentosus]|uniref:Uncharacterized protein n=1 Tax=Suillus fuscotomentosus TaxID=1912939 RepID=A0AAD4DYS7_9AGAM|nr:uncharacterized protein F5891DRAFT_1246729 [Suillus fuscotomentosus]KAG1896618.1 hypothetical protein F5891DRAFT_1246729 [Suillus fuscotomentosus]